MIQGKLVTIVDPVAELNDLKGAVQRRIMRKAIRNGAKPLLAAMKAAVPVRSGTLKKSLGTRVTITRRKQVVGLTGPRRRFVKVYDGKTIVATKYRHLVERGRKAVRLTSREERERKKKGRAMPIAPGIFRGSARAAKGKPFVDKAGSRAAEALEIVRRVTAEGIEQQLAKATAKSRGKR